VNRDLRLVALALLLWGIGEGLFLYFEPIYLEQLGADPVQIGLILGLTGAAAALSHIPAGLLADQWGSRVLLIASWLVGLAATGLMAFADALPLFTVGIILYRVSAFVMSPLGRYITYSPSDWTASRRLTTILSAFQVGLVLGAPLGGALAEAMGLRSIYSIAFVMFLLSTAVIFFIAPQKPIDEEQDGSPFRNLVRNHRFMGFAGLIFTAMLAMYLGWPLTPNYLQTVHQVPLDQIGIYGGLNALAGALFHLTLGRMESKRGLLIAQGFVLTSSFLLWQGTGIAAFALGYTFASAVKTAHWLATAEAGNFVSERNRGLVYGAMSTINSLTLLITPPLAGLLFSNRPQLPYIASMAMLLVTIFLSWAFIPASNQRAEAIPGYDDILGKG
jgi:predicted MFS family arabinose efflux permease